LLVQTEVVFEREQFIQAVKIPGIDFREY